MDTRTLSYSERLASGERLLLAGVSPPEGADPAPLKEAARQMAGKVHALSVSDNFEKVAMSALAAAAIVAAEGVEPILHVITRDRNRIALISEALGAQALGINNLLCTSGTHHVLGSFRTAKGVYDVDTVQLLQTYANMAGDGSLVGQQGFAGAGPYCLGGVAAVNADPIELQAMHIDKKIRAGAQFFITQPVFDLERFQQWWREITARGLHERAAFIAGIKPLADAKKAMKLAADRPSPRIPEAILVRVSSASGAAAQHEAGVAVALETMGRLSEMEGMRGFHICADGEIETALEILEKSARVGK
jgi:methylenetetrahydrofolate reductase (NADPH)